MGQQRFEALQLASVKKNILLELDDAELVARFASKCSLCDIFRPNISRIDGFIVERVSNLTIVQLVVCNRLIS